MVVRGWGGTVATAVGIGLAVGAAQLGIGYGLDIIGWASGRTGPAGVTEAANLSWATWIAASSAILGAVIAHRLGSGPTHPGGLAHSDDPAAPGAPTHATDPAAPHGSAAPGAPAAPDRVVRWLWRPALAIAAGLGATVTVLLAMLPARGGEAGPLVDGVGSTAGTAATYTALGVVAGVVIAVGALAARPIAANLLATTAWLWLLGVAGVVDNVIAGTEPTRIPLGFWETTVHTPWFRTISVPDAVLPLLAALVIGAVAALPATRRGDHPVGVVLSGGAGPLVLAVAYLIAQPNLTHADAVDVSRHLLLPYLVLAGICGALLVSLFRPGPVPEGGVASQTDEPAAAEPDGAAEPAPGGLDSSADPGTVDAGAAPEPSPTADLSTGVDPDDREGSSGPVPSPRTSD